MIKKLLITVLLCFFTLNASTKEEIRDRINNVLRKVPSSTRSGIFIYNPVEQDTIFALNHTVSMIPASNTKLFTTAVALNLLSGDFEVSTKLYTDDEDIKDGIINGNLYLKGFGNSLFSSSDLETMAGYLKESGITVITGDIIGDDSYFDEIYRRDDWITDEVANVKLPPISALVIDRNRTISYRKTKRRTIAHAIDVRDPASNAALQLLQKLKSNGITANGASKGITPVSADLLYEKSIPLRNLISLINKNSDNFMAECLFKTIGAEASGIQGNAFYSTQAILNYIDDNGIFKQGTAVVDGSGISRFDQITAGALGGLLEKMYFDLASYDDFYNSLSIAGVDGTLRNRMRGTSAENNFRGKTGTLNGVSSLSGYITTQGGDDLIVTFIFEFSRGGANLHRRVQDEIIQILADWD